MLGSFFLGTFCATVMAISYQRKLSLPPKAWVLCIVTLISFALFIPLDYKLNARKMLLNATPVWDTQTMPLTDWWNKNSDVIPLYRTGNFGYPAEVLNIEWAAYNLQVIRLQLLKNNWQPASTGITTFFSRLESQKTINHLDILPTLYADQRPSLVMTKIIPGISGKIVLRLWPANVILQPEKLTLYVGTMNYSHPFGKKFLHHTYHLISSKDALSGLFNDADKKYWETMIKHMNTMPAKLLPTPYSPHYTILIKPVSPQ
jgi:hypothetical protein